MSSFQTFLSQQSCFCEFALINRRHREKTKCACCRKAITLFTGNVKCFLSHLFRFHPSAQKKECPSKARKCQTGFSRAVKGSQHSKACFAKGLTFVWQSNAGITP